MRRWDSAPAAAGPASAEAGSVEQIGRYQLLEKIGEGGFGLVWRARQTTPILREVALKVIKFGMDSDQVLARFNAERQTLAMMDHPGIASVYDAGATENGLPYFVMELVEGPPLNVFCDRHQLGVEARLRLFIKICRAVQHAHQKGILHRDLKPGNILVAEVDGAPLPKIIDFGIAKALDSSAVPHTSTIHTRCDLLLGTPDYMSPEQTILGNQDLDTRADIYSLGAILYELLTGRTALEQQSTEGRGTHLHAMLHSVRKDEARRPSAVIVSLESADLRATTPHELSQRLKNDLDWITLKALAKNRTERYESADALANEIERHLEDLPITAGRPSLAQSTRKFIRRNRALTFSTTAVILALMTGILLATRAYFRESEARSEAEFMRQQAERHEAEVTRQRDLALQESIKASQTLAFLNRLLEDTGNLVAKGKNPEALRLALDGLSSEMDKFSADPTVQEAIYSRAALIYRALRDESKSVPLLERQLRLLEAKVAPNNPELLSARENYARALYLTGRTSESQAQYDLIIAGWNSLSHTRDGPRRLFLARRNRADVWSKTGRLNEALTEFADIKTQATQEMRNHPTWPVLQRTHAEALTSAGRWAEAEAVYAEALTELDLSAPEHQHTASMLHSKRATLSLKQNNLPAAVLDLERAIELQTLAKGAKSPWLPEWLVEVSRLHSARHRHSKAIAACEAALKNVLDTAQTNRQHLVYRALGDNLEAAGEYRKAAAAYLTASTLEKKMLPAPADAWLDLARAMRNLTQSGQPQEAAKLASELDAILPSWKNDTGRSTDVRLVEVALAFTDSSSPRAAGTDHRRDFEQIGQTLATPVIDAFLSRKPDPAKSPVLGQALKLLKEPATPAHQAAPLSAADFLAFDRAHSDRWKAGDDAALLLELAGALRLARRHPEAIEIYHLAAEIDQNGLPVNDRRHRALHLAAETLQQTGNKNAATTLRRRLQSDHKDGQDRIADPIVLAALAASLSPSAP